MATAAFVAAIAAQPAMALTLEASPAPVLATSPVIGGADNSAMPPQKAPLLDSVPIVTAPGGPNAAPMIAPAASSLPLSSLVDAYVAPVSIDPEHECLAAAVYFEARSEPLEGQLAIAEVVLNRAASGRYPSSLCAVVTQASQFSFVRKGKLPLADRQDEAWRKAVAIAHIARDKLAGEVAPGVLWYHASRVSPGWGRRLTRVVQIGAHIFYS
jgi:spore germination cell wall hydrolase CwlJ-like protein